MSQIAQSRLRLWLRVTPYYAYHATIIPIVLGTTIAWADKRLFNPGLFLLTLFGALSLHTATAMFNEFFDYQSKADLLVTHRNPYAGGSRVLTIAGGLQPRNLLAASMVFSLMGAVVGLYLTFLAGLTILVLGLVGFLFIYSYTAPPLRLSYRGLGEAAVGVSFGPLMVLGSYMVQAGTLDLAPLLLSMTVGLFTATILLFNEFPDYESDRAVGKRTLVVRLGYSSAIRLCKGSLALAYAILILGVVLRILPVGVLVGLLTVPLSLKVLKSLGRRYNDPDGMAPTNALMLVNHLVTGALIIAGYATLSFQY